MKAVLQYAHDCTFDRSACLQSDVCMETDWLHMVSLGRGRGDIMILPSLLVLVYSIP